MKNLCIRKYVYVCIYKFFVFNAYNNIQWFKKYKILKFKVTISKLLPLKTFLQGFYKLKYFFLNVLGNS